MRNTRKEQMFSDAAPTTDISHSRIPWLRCCISGAGLSPLQSPLHADVQPLFGRSGGVYASLGLGEGPGREPGRTCPGALLHAAAAVQNPRRVERLAAG